MNDLTSLLVIVGLVLIALTYGFLVALKVALLMIIALMICAFLDCF
jgi:hypothetical protein